MKDNIAKRARSFVEEECKKPTSKYGYEPFHGHFEPVVRYGIELAEKLGADAEVIELAGWLHDIGSIIYGREDHHITGAEIAEKKLRELECPEDRIQKVKICILNHRGSRPGDRSLLEAAILADADAMAAFNDVTGIFMAALVHEKLPREEARKSVMRKYINSYQKLSSDAAREIIKPRYEAIMLLLGEE